MTPATDARANPSSLADARLRLVRPIRREPVLPLLGASALLAFSACLLATAMILGPFWQVRPPSAASAPLDLR